MKSKEILYEKLYNPEAKRHFLEDVYVNEDTIKTIYYMFVGTAVMERELGRDLYEMTEKEIELVMHSLGAGTIRMAINYLSRIQKYLEWTALNGYRNSNIPKIVTGNLSEYAKQFVVNIDKKFYTLEEMYEHTSSFNSSVEKAIAWCLFDGIKGESYTEIANMKKEHLKEMDGKFYIDLYDTEKGQVRENFEIDEELYRLLLYVDSMEYYTDRRGASIEFSPSPYVFKKPNVGRKSSELKLGSNYFNNKKPLFREVFDNKMLQYTHIQQSGAMYYLNEMLNEKGDRVVTSEMLEEIADRYDKYKYMHTVTRELTYSYSKIKSFIDKEFFVKNYGEIEFA